MSTQLRVLQEAVVWLRVWANSLNYVKLSPLLKQT